MIDFWDWLEVGMKAGWISKPVCATHDGIPATEAEDNEWMEGFDPCQHIVRLWNEE